MIKRLEEKDFFVDLFVGEHSASITGGKIGGFEILPSHIFLAEIKNISGGVCVITSCDKWESIELAECDGQTILAFTGHSVAHGLSVFVTVKCEKSGAVWRVRVENACEQWSVMSINYPTPLLKSTEYDLFIPRFGGRCVSGVSKQSYKYSNDYPGTITMQYFAVYNKESGVYLGAEDEQASIKNFCATVENGAFALNVKYYGIDASKMGNSFNVSGQMRWQGYFGNWYDAAMIYADFVYKKASWLPVKGRPDTEEKFKKIPFWVSDYIPNIPSQGNNKPMLLSAGSDIYEPEYWYKAPLALQKELGGVPIAYHVYNWHTNPFNIEYPHFLPAKEVFLENAPRLRESGISVIPYINAVSWESRDGEMGHEISFANTGVDGAVLDEKGEMVYANYPQMTKSGHNSHLVPMCPSFKKWHEIIIKLAREMESTLPIDGIYFDEIAAHPAHPCYNPKHNHPLGGGSYWVEGDNEMMQSVIKEKGKGMYYLTESCAEPYMKSFDGYLTWNWVYPEDVPAFAAIYAGYVQMVGRVTDGKKKDDLSFFKYCNALSLVYGQQLGWCKADIIWRPQWLDFIKNAVRTRVELTEVFNSARMLRPPLVTTNLPQIVTEAGLDNKGNIVSEAVVAGAWKCADGDTVIITVNIANEKVDFTLSFNSDEYGIGGKPLPKEFSLSGDTCTVKSTLQNNGIGVWRIK